MAASNDVRGWVMSGISGVACVLGSSVICADVVLRKLSRRKSFQITSSSSFLSASLCLSAGVMVGVSLLFTSLYSMLPTSKQYLTRSGLSARASAYILIALFLAGVVVIRVFSALIHHHIPSHVVDCAHSHEPGADLENGHGEMRECDPEDRDQTTDGGDANGSTENTPLLGRVGRGPSSKSTPALVQHVPAVLSPQRRESLRVRLSRRISLLMGDTKALCDENGPCYGFSEACGRECTKIFVKANAAPPEEVVNGGDMYIPSYVGHSLDGEETPTPQTVRHVSEGWLDRPRNLSGHPENDYSDAENADESLNGHPHKTSDSEQDENHDHHHDDHHHHPSEQHKHLSPSQHHHHVPQNAFLSIGLQTSLAIALHKLPEGFITYATNHASPTLGMTVFLALFIHNISEGFAMALPLYLALNSRWKAMFWSSLLGGISQPLGAGIAALWIWGSRNNATEGPSWGVYGGMFAITAGVMTCVALQLFSEGLALAHNRNFCISCAIVGMGLMGLSFALTA
ncbi:hypothetical protein ASPZODRAFT_204858 [Penicilliopsis zonata CBS 506.65]|uniref:Zinc/iron permease n=1 Tax=Penicilliopsis zonata CBS 506.65 TaxID=1073090 RepID=A0A1L9STT6_9EURO|nr:hypothetical protein ASPZODRAFT_204858 [Penicilliopsis zonata CBS 506.65]OJJ50546.1 hypothetical protein ASPZODRAFT_204858 [Penicilliopsis zonata CBS 506.65]